MHISVHDAAKRGGGCLTTLLADDAAREPCREIFYPMLVLLFYSRGHSCTSTYAEWISRALFATLLLLLIIRESCAMLLVILGSFV
jgi:hypothetical protein